MSDQVSEPRSVLDDLLIPCADEPIHLSGSVQQHGFLLLLDPAFERVVAASDNAERFLGIPQKLILGARLAELFDREVMFSLARLQPGGSMVDRPATEGPVMFLGIFAIHGEAFSVVSHCIGTQRVLEFEVQERLVPSELMNSVITNFVSTLGSLRSEHEVCQALAAQVSQLTGFDRVMVYCFDKEGHGTVLAEMRNRNLPSCLDLRFPATDIPAQARRLYLLNTVRIIPDANYVPSPLLGTPGSVKADTIDLSFSTLRSVSPVHVEYMRNMGTMSSMSVSIIVDGKLWGLVSGHHATPHTVPYLVRSACDMLTRLLATQLNSFRTAQRLEQTLTLHAKQRSVLTLLASEPDYLDGLHRHLDIVKEITNAAGVALLVDGHLSTRGDTPKAETIERLAKWLDKSVGEPDVFSTATLARDGDWVDDEDIREHASGLIAIRISSVLHRYLLWFRPEIVRTVRWAGEPEKIAGPDRRLHPRHSFSEWQETVRGRAEDWTVTEVDSARDFRAALTSIGLRKAEEAVELGEARFQRLTESLPIKVFTADDEGRVTYANDQWLAFGLSRKGLWFEDPSLSEGDREVCRERWQEAVRTNSQFEAEVCVKTAADKLDRWNVVRAVPFQRIGAQRAGWVGTFVDMTEAKQREASTRMSEKLALTGRMTSVIAHEINNPLEAITNLMYLLRNEFEGKEGAAASYISMVESELERISGITKQTLRWSRETSDRSEHFTGGAIADDVLRLFAGKIRNRQITMRISGDRDTQFYGILGQLRQVLANLVSNAIDAAPLGGTVTIELFARDGHSGFAISDNGGGITEALQAKLFEPFLSTKGDLGNGLGLYISKEIVERHHGAIHVTTAAGQGTTMTVELPLAAADAP